MNTHQVVFSTCEGSIPYLCEDRFLSTGGSTPLFTVGGSNLRVVGHRHTSGKGAAELPRHWEVA